MTPRSAANNVYDVVAVTSFPAGDARKSYTEEYYFKDIGINAATGYFDYAVPDGVWTIDDPIVTQNASGEWVQDQKAKVRQVLMFADGSVRSETIVAQTDFTKTPSLPKFAAFDVNGSLEFSQLFYPTTDANAVFSSVVVYNIAPPKNYNFWFWQGTQGQNILGIRYYTEFKDAVAGKYYCYTLMFEKTLSTLTTQGGSFTETLGSVFIGSQFDTLAESVLRQETVYSLDANGNPLLSTGKKATNMKMRVVNITGRKDLFLQQLNSDYVELSGWDTTTIYTPSGDAEEVLAGDSTAFVFNRTQIAPTGGTSLPIAVTDTSGVGDLATLYTSLTEGAGVISTGTVIPGSLQPEGTEWLFNGKQGSTLPLEPAYDLSKTGTVEAWVYVNQHTNTAGIVHKGIQADFSDECYSLQFWGSSGQLAFILSGPNSTATGGYDLLTSTINLNTKKWYYLVATWDTGAATPYINLYINGVLNKTMKPQASANGARVAPGANLIVGSQLPVTYSAVYGYFGFNGKINGVRVSTPPMSAAEVLSTYNQYKSATANW